MEQTRHPRIPADEIAISSSSLQRSSSLEEMREGGGLLLIAGAEGYASLLHSLQHLKWAGLDPQPTKTNKQCICVSVVLKGQT